MLESYLPRRVNVGPWVTAYTLPRLRELGAVDWVLPICSLGTPYERVAELGDYLLPPLFHEALDDRLKRRMIARIQQCFPAFQLDSREPPGAHLRVVELPAEPHESTANTGDSNFEGSVLAFSVDTAVEEHGPHLPLATDTIQSYGVLERARERVDGLVLGKPVEYGQLTWGLPFGMSVDLTAELLTEYVRRFADAVSDRYRPAALYVVDVHGSIVHRRAIVEGLRRCGARRWAFRWLHEPLAEFASERGDQHAGGVETAMVEQVDPRLLDSQWWPDRIEDLAAAQLGFAEAVELTPDLPRFFERVVTGQLNGIVGDILNYHSVDGAQMMARSVEIATRDVERLARGESPEQGAGESLW